MIMTASWPAAATQMRVRRTQILKILRRMSFLPQPYNFTRTGPKYAGLHAPGLGCQAVTSSSDVTKRLRDNNNNNNNNNKHDNVYGAVIMADALREFTRFI